jgi:hypothetical protein
VGVDRVGTVAHDVLRRPVHLVPFLERLDVDASNVEAGLKKPADQVAADESSGAGHENSHGSTSVGNHAT